MAQSLEQEIHYAEKTHGTIISEKSRDVYECPYIKPAPLFLTQTPKKS